MIPRLGGDADFTDVGSTMQVPQSGARFVTVGEQDVMLVRAAGGAIAAFGGRCTHAFARLSDGTVADGVVECPLHGARFALATGKSLSRCPDLPRLEVRIDGRRVLVKPR